MFETERRIYLDHSATTPVDERVVVIMNEFMLEKFGNPSSSHSFGREAKAALENAREPIAALLNAAPEEIFFTSGGTESDNLALLGYALKHRDKGNQVIISSVEHPAVRAAAEELARSGFQITRVKADAQGLVAPEAINEALTPQTILVSIMHANNEIGTINDIGTIGRLLRERGIGFHTDAVQSFGKAPIDVQEMAVDLASISSHKIYGPKGVGAIYIRKGVEVYPRFWGGHQEGGNRSGTENLPGIVGFGKAAELCRQVMSLEGEQLSELRDELLNMLVERLDDITINGHPTRRLPGNLSITFQGVEGEALLMALDLEGIAASSGSACSSGSAKPSPVLIAIGLTEQEAHATLRFSLGRSNVRSDIVHAAKVIIDAVNRLRAMAGFRPAAAY